MLGLSFGLLFVGSGWVGWVMVIDINYRDGDLVTILHEDRSRSF